MYKSSEPVLTEFGFSKKLPYHFFMMFHWWSRTLETLTQLEVISIGDTVVPNLSIIVDLLWCLIACLCEEEARLTRREVMF